ncbi:MarR family winged helix-turn-helix transcriptional regulator [Croceibacterium salegens]|nr:MarR family transcriptional regulator [Croceibacterium salegens]
MEEATSFATYRGGETPPDMRLTILLVLVARRWRTILDEKLRPTGQSSARMEALSAILNSPDRSAQVEIAKRLRIEGPTLTRMIDTLEKDGLVTRMPDPADRRSKLLKLTQEGEETLHDIFNLADTYRARLLDGVPAEDKAAVSRFLTGLLDRLDTGLPGDDA